MKSFKKFSLIYFLLSFTFIFAFVRNFDVFSRVSSKEKFDHSQMNQERNQKEASKSQAVVSRLEKERQSLLDQYKRVLIDTESVLIYNNNLRSQIQSQKERLILVEKQIESLKRTQGEIVPLMMRMIDNLEKLINLDVPFLIKDRRNRVKELRKVIGSAHVSSSEKFRKIMEAYQIENEYGRTLEAYNGTIQLDGKEFSVDFLRLGRLTFIYQTLDKKRRGIWNHKQRKWQPLKGGAYKVAVTKSIKVARKQVAPDLLKFPVLAPEGEIKSGEGVLESP